MLTDHDLMALFTAIRALIEADRRMDEAAVAIQRLAELGYGGVLERIDAAK